MRKIIFIILFQLNSNCSSCQIYFCDSCSNIEYIDFKDCSHFQFIRRLCLHSAFNFGIYSINEDTINLFPEYKYFLNDICFKKNIKNNDIRISKLKPLVYTNYYSLLLEYPSSKVKFDISNLDSIHIYKADTLINIFIYSDIVDSFIRIDKSILDKFSDVYLGEELENLTLPNFVILHKDFFILNEKKYYLKRD